MAADSNRVLIVAGDFEVISRVQTALRSASVDVQVAYSQKDSLYLLESVNFDVIVVDPAMISRRGGERTMLSLARMRPAVPFLAPSVADRSPVAEPLPGNITSVGRSETAIFRALQTYLRLPDSAAPAGDAVVPPGEGQLRWTDESSALMVLGRSLTEVLDLSEVLNRLVEAARHLTAAEEGMILLPDAEVGQLYLRAKVGIDVEVARNFRIRTEDTIAGRVYASSQPVLIGAQGPQKVKTEYLVNSLLYVPIMYEGRCIGVLGVNNRRSEEVFSGHHQELLQSLASFAAIAIENARIHEEALERARELRTLVEASQVLNASLSLDTTLLNACEQMARVLNTDVAQVFEWNREHERLCRLASFWRITWTPGSGPTVDLLQRPALKKVMDSGVTSMIGPGAEAPSPQDAHHLSGVGAVASLIMPVSAGEQMLGVVQLFYCSAPSSWPDEAMLHRLRNQAFEALVTLSNQTTTARSSAVIKLIEDLNRLSGADWCELMVILPERGDLKVGLCIGRGLWLNDPYPYLDLRRYPDLVEALQSHVLITRTTETRQFTPGLRALLDSAYARSFLALPLIFRGQSHGLMLFADARRNRVFGQRDMDMGRAIVGQSATALENARLFNSLERSLVDLKDAQSRLVQSARLSAMGELAAAVAHQISNPLTAVTVNAQMLLEDEKPDSHVHKYVQTIYEAGNRAKGVARRLLAISRPSGSDAPPEQIDVVESIEGVLSLVRAHIERNHIQIETHLPEAALPSIVTIPGQLDDIWLNLLLNANDALIGRPDARVGIGVTMPPAGRVIEVRVWDNGPGIPADIVDDIFKPFFTTKPVGAGTGLGLHICRQAAERIGGSISVKSAPGRGAEFLVRLPVKPGGGGI